jgi:hypothetical protein
MNYLASITDFFKSPKWGMNLLLGAFCFIIPYIGTIVLQGWHITAMWTRKNVDPAKYPEFDFGQFGSYLQRGLWPFLVALVVGLAMLPILGAVMIVGMFAFVALMTSLGQEAVAPFFGMLVMAGLAGVIMIGMHLVGLPFTVGASITQDFGRAFNFGFVKQFVGKVWMELILSALFMSVAFFVLLLAGALACFIGIYATLPISLFAWHHLEKQLYELYLSRGGEPLMPAPGLLDTPPPFPPPAVPMVAPQPG